MPPSLVVTETPEYKGHTLACQRFITNTCAGKYLLLLIKNMTNIISNNCTLTIKLIIKYDT